jgi:hypothetical protein
MNEWFLCGEFVAFKFTAKLFFFASIMNTGAFCSADNNHKREEEETKKLQMSFFYSPISSLFNPTKDYKYSKKKNLDQQ